MATYHVFIERAREPGARGEQALAAAVAERYGLPADQIAARLAAGRMRVKTNVDRATADTFAADLERLGAVCAIVDVATGEPVAPVVKPSAPARAATPALPPRATPAPATASALPPRTTPAPATASALPPRATPAPATTSAPPPRAPTPAPVVDAPPARPSGAFSSGLSAAFSADANSGAADLGALSSGEFALSALDGTDDAGPGSSDAGLPASFGPPAPSDAGLPASFGPASPAMGATGATGAPAQAPIDLFAPPDAESEPELDVAVDVRAERRAAPPVAAAEPSPRRGPLAAAMAEEASPAPVVQRGGALAQWVADARVRLAAGVVVAILVGFLPAHVVASMREGSAFAEVDRELARAQSKQQVVTIEHWNELDATRAKALARKEDKQRDIALASMLLWALVGAGVAYVWFRVIDWYRLGARLGA